MITWRRQHELALDHSLPELVLPSFPVGPSVLLVGGHLLEGPECSLPQWMRGRAEVDVQEGRPIVV